MSRFWILILGSGVCVGVLAGVYFFMGNNFPEVAGLRWQVTPLPVPAHLPRRVKVSIPYWDQKDAVASFKAHRDDIDNITVFWYALLANGKIGKYPYATVDPDLVKYAHARGIKVFVLLANLPTENEGGDWDNERVARVISSKDERTRHIADIMQLVRGGSYDGVNIDYEALSKKQRGNFSAFIRELAQALHAEGKLLSVSLHPKVGENNPRWSNGSQAQDWKQLAQWADHLSVMTQQEHWESSGPGPAASPAWTEEVLRYARTLIPPEKLYAVLPLYGYDWQEKEDARGLTHADVSFLIKKYRPTVTWDERGGSYHFSYRDSEGARHEVWYEDARASQAKLALLARLSVSNISIWRLGGEDQTVWSAIANWRKSLP